MAYTLYPSGTPTKIQTIGAVENFNSNDHKSASNHHIVDRRMAVKAFSIQQGVGRELALIENFVNASWLGGPEIPVATGFINQLLPGDVSTSGQLGSSSQQFPSGYINTVITNLITPGGTSLGIRVIQNGTGVIFEPSGRGTGNQRIGSTTKPWSEGHFEFLIGNGLIVVDPGTTTNGMRIEENGAGVSLVPSGTSPLYSIGTANNPWPSGYFNQINPGGTSLGINLAVIGTGVSFSPVGQGANGQTLGTSSTVWSDGFIDEVHVASGAVDGNVANGGVKFTGSSASGARVDAGLYTIIVGPVVNGVEDVVGLEGARNQNIMPMIFLTTHAGDATLTLTTQSTYLDASGDHHIPGAPATGVNLGGQIRTNFNSTSGVWELHMSAISTPNNNVFYRITYLA